MVDSNGVKQVVVIGGGFAGLNCAQRLAAHSNFQITLIDRSNYQQFQPLLYQVATGVLSPNNAAFNLRAVLSHYENVDVVMAEVQSVDMSTKAVTTSDGQVFHPDYLVLAAGAEPNFFGVPGVKEYALPLYSLHDAERLRSRLLSTLESADRDHQKREAPLRFIVIGGGATGVEIAGAIGDILKRTPTQVFKHLDLTHASIVLIDSAKTVLTPFSEHSRAYTTDALQDRGVELKLETSVKEVTSMGVTLADGRSLTGDLVIWAGGLKASGLSASLGIKTGRGGRIDVQSDLSVEGFPGVYALGDFANTKDESGKGLPQLASVAQQAGRHCAKNIAAAERGEFGTPFKYLDKGIMAMVGRNAAVAEVGAGRHTVTGTMAFAAWLGVHALLLTTPRAKVETFVEWAWEYFGHVHVDPILDRPEVDWSNDASALSSRSDAIRN